MQAPNFSSSCRGVSSPGSVGFGFSAISASSQSVTNVFCGSVSDGAAPPACSGLRISRLSDGSVTNDGSDLILS